jgi:hypothetical protein
MKKLSLAVVLVLLLATPASGFDGLRKGFVLGAGVGLAPTASWNMKGGGDDSSVGGGFHFLIGYAWDEFNMIVYEGNVAVYSTLLDATATQGINSATWYHYFGPQGQSWFTAAGLGFYDFSTTRVTSEAILTDNTNPGAALLVGGGFEFSRHVQAGVYVSVGKTSKEKTDWNHTHVNVLVSAVAF